ncbi:MULTISPECIES: UvrD-helicase domain-containing protein [unclassified Streptomyces]|uniref:UvrD-helicase domain-containing protein n=1 Tax=unclassified Streptomyces TaxID=2593676 RepID=UPI00168BFA30|nr:MULTISPECIES: UvrD-helicase domain-containing protein [unclassified Streptomyces]MBD3007969.1 AAA family ATPase [Streptomyces sp. 5-10]
MTSLYAPDVFIKDKVEQLAQQLGLELPHKEQWDFIQSAESLDLQAAPGSGKTSLIGLKLALLGQGWASPTRGICVLSHTNTAKDEISSRLAVTPEGRRLLQYPHFIGTIQSFANTFFALPALRARGIEVQAVDDDVYAAASLRLLERHPGFRTLKTALGHRRNGSALVAEARYVCDAGPTSTPPSWTRTQSPPDGIPYAAALRVVRSAPKDWGFLPVVTIPVHGRSRPRLSEEVAHGRPCRCSWGSRGRPSILVPGSTHHLKGIP